MRARHWVTLLGRYQPHLHDASPPPGEILENEAAKYVVNIAKGLF